MGQFVQAFKPTVLVVDDNSEILSFLEDDLEEKYEVLTATSVKTALRLLEDHTVSLIVSDVMMPEMDGYGFCNMIKSNLDLSHIPVILLTAKNALNDKIKGLELGADAYIEKPFSPEHLQVQINNLLISRNKLREYFSSYPLSSINSMAHTPADEQFLGKLHQLITRHIDDPSLDVNTLSERLFISRPTLYRKIKAISDLTPNELINITRLKKAAELLAQGFYNVTDVSVMVGFNSATHFGRCFLKQFGVSPSSFAQRPAKPAGS
ncbi:MAG TPA: response regulator [Arachidicoccus sp.]|nr:response regulator [Arachidicoccus sp.]